MSTSSTLTTAAIQPLLHLLDAKGLVIEELSKAGLNSEHGRLINPRISIAQFDRVLEQASRILNEPAIGLTIGKQLKFSNFYLLSFLLSSCSTGREVLTLLRRYYSLVISDSHSPDLFVGQQSTKLVFYVAEGNSFGSQARTELVAAGIHSAGKTFGNKLYQVLGVGFKFPAPHYQKRIEDFFGVPIQYNQPHNWISFSSGFIDKPLAQISPELFGYLRRQAEYALSRFDKMPEFSSKVMHVLYQWPDSIPITKEAVAELLNTSSRTLTRRLQEEGNQFSYLLKSVRLEKAKQALEDGFRDVQQLAIDLGFSDRRGFERAFKQWTGDTPAAYRRNFQEQEEARLSQLA